MDGHFLREEDQLLVTLEAIDVRSNKLIWQGTLAAPSHNRAEARNPQGLRSRKGSQEVSRLLLACASMTSSGLRATALALSPRSSRLAPFKLATIIGHLCDISVYRAPFGWNRKFVVQKKLGRAGR